MNKNITWREMLDNGKKKLQQNNIATAKQDIDIFAQHILKCDKAKLILCENETVNEKQQTLFFQFIKQRITHKSVWRILGKRQFYTIELELSPDVLEPRADSECLVEAVLQYVKNNFHKNEKLYFADLGCGTGAIALALLHNLPNAYGLATDISSQALKLTKKNAATCHLADRLETRQANWAEGLPKNSFDFIVCNPPYIASEEIKTLSRQVLYDPILALDGGADGLCAYRNLLQNVAKPLKNNGFFAYEIGYNQLNSTTYLAKQAGWDIINCQRDLGGHPRAVIAKKRRQ